jgi:integrase
MSIQFKDGIWYAVIYYRDELNKKRYRWYPAEPNTEKAAEKLERKLRYKKDAGELIVSERSALKEFLQTWLEDAIKPSKAPATYTNFKYYTDCINKNLGDIQLSELKPLAITKHINKELERGLAPTSVHCQITTLKEALDQAVKWQLIATNPCSGVEIPARNDPGNNFWTLNQVDKFLDFTKATSLFIIWLLGFLCGLRRGEILGLRWQDVDLKDKSAFVRHSLDRMEEAAAERLQKQGKVVWFGSRSVHTSKDKQGKEHTKITVLALGPTKTKRSKGKVALPDMVVEILEFIRKRQMVNSARKGKMCDEAFVITKEDGRPYEPDYITHALPRYIGYYNKGKKPEDQLPAIRVHDMRHTYVSLLYDEGLDDKAVSEAARHSRTSFTTDYYVHIREQAKRKPAEVINAKFGTKII